jgi:HK97 family phage major capsid protein
MLDAQNNRIFVPRAGAEQFDYLLGIPVIFTGRAAALGTEGDVMLADLSTYLIHEGMGPQIAFSTEASFKYGNTTLRANWYMDATPGSSGTITLPNGVAASSIVRLGAV